MIEFRSFSISKISQPDYPRRSSFSTGLAQSLRRPKLARSSRHTRRRDLSSLPDSPGSISASTEQGQPEGTTEGIKLARRTLQVTFTCNKCGVRTQRLVNPLAWDKGLVFAQCKGCEAWHKLRDNESFIEEVKFSDEEEVKAD